MAAAFITGGDNPRVLVRGIAVHEPHFYRDKGQWVCRARLGPWGYGSSFQEAHDDWRAALREWANQIPGKPAGCAQDAPRQPARLMAHVGNPLVETCHVRQAR